MVIGIILYSVCFSWHLIPYQQIVNSLDCSIVLYAYLACTYVDSTIKQKAYLGYRYVPIIGYRKNSKGSG